GRCRLEAKSVEIRVALRERSLLGLAHLRGDLVLRSLQRAREPVRAGRERTQSEDDADERERDQELDESETTLRAGRRSDTPHCTTPIGCVSRHGERGIGPQR